MRVAQLLESSDFSPLTKIWHGNQFAITLRVLRTMGEDEEMLASILNKAYDKHSVDSPEVLLTYIKPLIDVQNNKSVDHSTRYEYGQVLNQLLTSIVVAMTKMDAPAIRKLQDKIDLNELAKHLDAKLGVKLKLAGWKINRTPDQEKQDEENELFVFIGRPGFKETKDGNYRKMLEIERLVKIDRFSSEHHQMVAMMKLRARVQGENSEVYQITLPAGMVDDTTNPPDWLVTLIDEHKTRVH
jgi:hypothetical protein